MQVVLQEGVSEARLYSIAGRTLSVSTNERSLAQMAERFLGNFYYQQLEEPSSSDVTCPISIQRDNPPPIPTGFLSFETNLLGDFYTDGEKYHLIVNDSTVVVGTPARPQVDVWLGNSAAARHPVALVNVMSCALQFALRRCGLSQLHSAGVIEPETGSGVLIVGDSNSGKSSLTVRLARSGWPYLSDDMLLLHELGQTVKARALRRVFSVSCESIADCDLPRLEDALGPAVNIDVPQKHYLEPSIAFPDRFAECCEPAVVLFPRITHEAQTRIESLSKSESLLRFLKFSPWACFDADGKNYLRLIERLVRQTRAFAVHAGRDLHDDVTLAPRLFAELLKG